MMPFELPRAFLLAAVLALFFNSGYAPHMDRLGSLVLNLGQGEISKNFGAAFTSGNPLPSQHKGRMGQNMGLGKIAKNAQERRTAITAGRIASKCITP